MEKLEKSQSAAEATGGLFAGREIAYYEAAGNRFAIILAEPTETGYHYDSGLVNKVFSSSPNIDTVLYLIRMDDSKYKYLVLERDGSQSEMCGNGARAVAKYLYDSGIVEKSLPVILVTRAGQEFPVYKVGEDRYSVSMGQVLEFNEDNKEHFTEFVQDGKFWPDIDELFHLLKGGVGKEVYDGLFPKSVEFSNYRPYFNYWIKMLSRDPKYEKFLSSIKYAGLYMVGGEPHTLVEITQVENLARLEVYLKVTSFLLRAAGEYPKSMNFMFFYINGATVQMFPAERGVHKGDDYDQTGACGTGSVCLASHLMRKGGEEGSLDIRNRSGEELTVSTDGHGYTLTGTAKEIDARLRGGSDVSYLPPAARLLIDAFFIECPDGERDIESLVKELKDVGMDIFANVRGTLAEVFGQDGVPVFTTIDHPNPQGYFDIYTLTGYVNTAFIAERMGLKVLPISLDTTGTRGSDFPYSSSMPKLPNNILSGFKRDDSFFTFVQRLVAESLVAENNKNGLENILSGLEELMEVDRMKSNKKSNNKLVRSLREFFSEYFSVDKNSNESEIKKGNESSSRISSGDNVGTSGLFEAANVLVLLVDALQEYRSRYINNLSLTKKQRINAWQACVKGAINRAIYDMVLTSEQRELMKKVGILGEDGFYKTPELQSLHAVNGALNEAFITIFTDFKDPKNSESSFLLDYFKYFLERTGKQNVVLLTGAEGERIVCDKDGFRIEGKKETIAENELIELIRKGNFVLNGVAVYIVHTFGLSHVVGSERGGREFFLDYLERRLGEFPENQRPLLQRVIEINRVLVCPDYIPEKEYSDYVGHPIGIDTIFPCEGVSIEGSGKYLIQYYHKRSLAEDKSVAYKSFAKAFQYMLKYPYGI